MGETAQDTKQWVTGTLKIGESLEGPFVLTYLVEASKGAVAQLDQLMVPLPLAGRLYLSAEQSLNAVAILHDSLGMLLYSGYRPA